MNNEMEEFDRTSNNRRNQLAETQRLTIEKFDKECLTKYGINMLSYFPNNNHLSYYGVDNNNGSIVINNMSTSISSSSQTSLTNSNIISQTQPSQNTDLNNLINNTTNNQSSAIQTNNTPQSSAIQFVGSTNNHQPKPQYQPGNRSSVLVTSGEYLKSQPNYISLQQQQQQQQFINQVYNPTTSVLVFADNSYSNNRPSTNPGIVMREHRSNSLLNQKIPLNQPKNSQSIASPNIHHNNTSIVSASMNAQSTPTSTTTTQQNRRNSTAFT